jgi:hypothetical protein
MSENSPVSQYYGGVQVRERLKDELQEKEALENLVKTLKGREEKQAIKHQEHLEAVRRNAQDQVAAARNATEATEKALEQLQVSVAVQLADAKKRVHQAEAKSNAVRHLTRERMPCSTE